MSGSILVARILGIDVRIHFSWFLIFAILLYLLADQILPAQYPFWSDQKTLVVAAIAAVLFFASVLAHELAHAVVARIFRMQVSSITLFLLGGVANLRQEPPSAKAEFAMAGVGPLTSLVIGLLGIAVEALATAPALQPVQAIAGYLGPVNIVLAAFNLLPGFPLDGGRVLRSVIWAVRRDRAVASRVAARGGQIVAGLLAVLGVVAFVGRQVPLNGGMLLLIAYFLYSAASATLQQERMGAALGSAKVGQLMTTEFRTATPATLVGALIRDLVLPFNLQAVPVVSGGRVVGLVTVGDLRKVEQEAWAATPVEAVMTALDERSVVAPNDRLATALERFAAQDLPLLPVVEAGLLVGVLYREALLGYVRMREMLGMER